MIKRSPSRNNRSKGIKVKHVLQIILLLGVCFWLIYQVKHSHDKKKEFDENDAKVSVGTQTAYQTLKLGRKDLHPGKDEVNQNEKHEEEEEDENIVEDEDKHEHNEHEEGNEHGSEEKDDKHGVRGGGGGGGDEQEEDENKSDEMEDERVRGDDEIDENDQEQSAVDTNRDEEFMDEEKGKGKEKEEEGDEKEKENSKDEEKDGSVENHNSHEAREEHYKGDDASSAVTQKEKEEDSDEKEKENSKDEEKDGSVENHNNHEAQEEHYKGDDASSAVTHDTGTTSTEIEILSLENSDVNSEMNIAKLENRPNNTEESNRNQHSSNFNITEAELPGGFSSNATSGKETGSNSLSNAVDSSHLDNITTTYSDSHSEAGSNLAIVIPGGSNNLPGTSANTSSEQNKMVIFSESIQAQNGTVNITVTGDVKNVQTKELEQGGNRVSEEIRPGSTSAVPVETEKGDAAAGESSNLEGGELEKTKRFVASNETEINNNTEASETNMTRNISHMKENTDATKDEFKGDTQTDETSDTSSAIGTSDSVEHHDTDSHILKNVAEVRTDLDMLPDIRNEGVSGDATATD